MKVHHQLNVDIENENIKANINEGKKNQKKEENVKREIGRPHQVIPVMKNLIEKPKDGEKNVREKRKKN